MTFLIIIILMVASSVAFLVGFAKSKGWVEKLSGSYDIFGIGNIPKKIYRPENTGILGYGFTLFGKRVAQLKMSQYIKEKTFDEIGIKDKVVKTDSMRTSTDVDSDVSVQGKLSFHLNVKDSASDQEILSTVRRHVISGNDPIDVAFDILIANMTEVAAGLTFNEMKKCSPTAFGTDYNQKLSSAGYTAFEIVDPRLLNIDYSGSSKDLKEGFELKQKAEAEASATEAKAKGDAKAIELKGDAENKVRMRHMKILRKAGGALAVVRAQTPDVKTLVESGAKAGVDVETSSD